MAPESTRAAILAAARAGAQMVELDVQMTRDGRLVIFHDDRLERTTNGTGRVTHRLASHLARLDAGAWFDPRFAGERILSVTNAIRLLPPSLQMNLELKRTRHPRALLDRFVRLVQRAGIKHRLLVSSFDWRLLAALRRYGIATALLCRRDANRSLQRAIRLGCRAWHPFVTVVTPRRIARAHAAGLQVNVWVVDNPVRARQLSRWGVDGLFTNHPARLREVRRR